MPVEGQHVRLHAHDGGPRYPPGVHVHSEEGRIDVAGDEGEPGRAVHSQAVVVLATPAAAPGGSPSGQPGRSPRAGYGTARAAVGVLLIGLLAAFEATAGADNQPLG